MKKNILLALVVCSVGVWMTSCTTYMYTSRSAAIKGSTIDSRAMGAEVTADYSRTITATSDPQSTQGAAMNEAVFKCLQEPNVDIVVDPIYKTEFRMFKKKPFTVTVVGFAGSYKQVPVGMDAFVQKKYTIEDIEKYKLLYDPAFLQYYYQKDAVPGAEITNYYINSLDGSVTPAPAKSEPKSSSVVLKNTSTPAPLAPAKKVKPLKSMKQSKQLRDAGASLMGIGGGLMFIVGGGCIAGYEKYSNLYRQNYNRYGYNSTTEMYDRKESSCMVAHLTMTSIGLACIVAGVPMVSVGQVRMNKNKKASLAFGGTGEGLGMRLTF